MAALAEIFKGEDITYQFPVGPYRVDMYLPAYNIVVECDEHGHRRYKKEHEDMRAQYIEDAIGCRFVRFDPDGKCFSAFPVSVLSRRVSVTLGWTVSSPVKPSPDPHLGMCDLIQKFGANLRCGSETLISHDRCSLSPCVTVRLRYACHCIPAWFDVDAPLA